jgi:hypothetical protein
MGSPPDGAFDAVGAGKFGTPCTTGWTDGCGTIASYLIDVREPEQRGSSASVCNLLSGIMTPEFTEQVGALRQTHHQRHHEIDYDAVSAQPR